jgi:NAD-dependent SIR2 family protein deacetylase
MHRHPMVTRMDPTIARVRDLLHQASAIAALTGAGISAESGIPTFRGPGGIWRTYRAENLEHFHSFCRA